MDKWGQSKIYFELSFLFHEWGSNFYSDPIYLALKVSAFKEVYVW